MNRSCRSILFFAAATVLLADGATGDVIISTRSVDSVTGTNRTQRTLISRHLVRTEDGGKASIVRSDLGKIWELSRGQACVEYDLSDLALLHQKAEDERPRMLESMAAPTPAPDAQAPATGMSLQSSATLQLTYRKLASGEAVGKWTCDLFAKEVGGMKIGEVCVVPLSSLKLKLSELAGLQEADTVFGAAPSRWDQETLSLLKNKQAIGYEAFPVRISVIDGSGRARFVSELSGLTLRKLPARPFQPPAGCTPAVLPQ